MPADKSICLHKSFAKRRIPAKQVRIYQLIMYPIFDLQTYISQPLPTYDTLAMNWIELLFQVHCGEASDVDHELFQDCEKNIISMIGYQSYTCFRHQYITLLQTKFNGKVTCWQKWCTDGGVDNTYGPGTDMDCES